MQLDFEQESAKKASLTPAQKRFLNALLGARTVKEAAALAGIAETTGYRFMSRPRFRAELQRVQDMLLQQALGATLGMLTDALHTLSEVMNDQSAAPAVRVSAARAVLEIGIRFAEYAALAERVAALEAQLAGGLDNL